MRSDDDELEFTIEPLDPNKPLHINPEFVVRDEQEFVVLSKEDFHAMLEKIEDLGDLILIYESKLKNNGRAGIDLEELEKQFRDEHGIMG